MNDGLSDHDLLRQVRAGDKQAVAVLYDRYSAPVMNLAAYVLGNRESAEEVVQDVFVTVWKRPEVWDAGRGSFLTWLLTITRNRAIDRLRGREGSASKRETSLEIAPELASDDMPLEGVDWDNARALRGLVERLPTEQSQLIEMAFYKGMTHTLIADATGIPLGTVKTRLRVGLQALRRMWLREMESVGDE
jgi:RNA polymerase sigma-70 factor (ECF subfamily)